MDPIMLVCRLDPQRRKILGTAPLLHIYDPLEQRFNQSITHVLKGTLTLIVWLIWYEGKDSSPLFMCFIFLFFNICVKNVG